MMTYISSLKLVFIKHMHLSCLYTIIDSTKNELYAMIAIKHVFDILALGPFQDQVTTPPMGPSRLDVNALKIRFDSCKKIYAVDTYL